jgi:hypothetical protein
MMLLLFQSESVASGTVRSPLSVEGASSRTTSGSSRTRGVTGALRRGARGGDPGYAVDGGAGRRVTR